MTVLTFDSVDDYLGPAQDRFFGAGYRRSEIDLGSIVVGPHGAHGMLGVAYPKDWSRKAAGIDLRPHLSTIDGLLVAAQLTDALLTVRHGLVPEDRAEMRLDKVVIRAGTEPDENLAALPATAEVRRAGATEDGTATTSVDVGVGRMRVRCQVTHPVPGRSGAPGPLRAPEVLGAPDRRYWGDGFRSGRQSVRNVRADVGDRRATADLTTAALPGTVDQGLGGRPGPVTFVDAFVSALQVFQILLYEVDGLSRAESSTLWMQQTTLTYDPDRPASSDLSVEIAQLELIELPNGTWRNATFDALAGPVRQRSVFAHHLPAHAAALTR